METVFANALTGCNLGAAAGGADFNPHNKSEAEIQRCISLAVFGCSILQTFASMLSYGAVIWLYQPRQVLESASIATLIHNMPQWCGSLVLMYQLQPLRVMWFCEPVPYDDSRLSWHPQF